ncbi:NUDIX hydrolase [Kribbella qitaiheensis]|uniref:NUDIX hydrolase n=1 Tax=Kribbella qitaiheensis TaxID=1544730 RepID=UPI003D18BA3D
MEVGPGLTGVDDLEQIAELFFEQIHLVELGAFSPDDLEKGESATECAVREGYEETGTKIEPTALQLVHTMHRGHDTEAPRLGLFFTAAEWEGEPTNAEPHKCGAIGWFPLDQLPAEMVPYPRAGLDNYLSGTPYAELGW